MPDKPSKVEKKMTDLTGQNSMLLNKMLKRLGASGLIQAGSEESGKQKKDDKSSRAIFQDINRSVITGYSKPGSKSVTGPFDFFNKYMGDTGDDAKEAGGTPKKMPPWYKKLIGPALLILGGLAAFVMGIMTDGPLKGFLKLLSQGGIMGGLKWMANILTSVVSKSIGALTKVFGKDAVAKVLGSGKTLVTKIMLPFKRFFISTVPKFIGKLVGPLVKIVGGSAGGVTKMLAKVGVFVVKNLKFIPLLGGLISFGFAISRFRKGDVIGGTIDLVSGVLGMVPPGPWSAITVPLSIGLSVLNAVLDAKSGGATGKQQGAKGDMLKKWAGKLFGMIAEIPPISNVYHLAQGIVQGVKGNWKAAANHFMYSIPIVGTLLDWFGVGFKDPEGKPIEGNKSSFFSKLIGFIAKIPPISTVINLGKALGAVFQGKWGDAATYFAYSLPGVGSVLEWFNVGSPGEPKGEKVEGDKKGFWSSIWNFITKLPPISNVIHLAKGISNIFKGNFVTAGKHMMRSIPIIGNLISWFGGDVGTPAENEPPGDKKGFFGKIKGAFLDNFKKIWGKLPKWAKWVAKKLPFIGSLLKQLDTQGDAEFDAAADAEVGGAVMKGYDDVKKMASGMWGGIKGGYQQAKEQAKANWNKTKEVAGKMWGGMKDVYQQAKDQASANWKKTKEVAGKLWGGIKDHFSQQWEQTKERLGKVKEVAGKLWGGIKDHYSKQWEDAKEKFGIVSDVAKKAWGTVKDGYSDLANAYEKEGVKGVMKEAGNKLSSAGKSIADGAKTMWKKAKGWLSWSPPAWEYLMNAGKEVADGTKKIAKEAPSFMSRMGSSISTMWSGWFSSAKKVQKTVASKLGMDSQPKQSPLLTATLKQITYQKNTWLRLQKIHISITKSHTEIKDILRSALHRTPGTQVTIARDHLRVADMMSGNIAAIYDLLEMSVYPNAEHRGRLIGGAKAAKMRQEMSVEQDSSNLNDSVSIQQDMLKELKDGSIYKEIASMNKNMTEKLDIIADNIGQTGGGNILGIPGSSRANAAQSPSRFDRMGNRQQAQSNLP